MRHCGSEVKVEVRSVGDDRVVWACELLVVYLCCRCCVETCCVIEMSYE